MEIFVVDEVMIVLNMRLIILI